jgi:hypothetical protein
MLEAYGVRARPLPAWREGAPAANVAAWRTGVVHNMSLLRYSGEYPSLGSHRDASHFACVIPLEHDAASGGGTTFDHVGSVEGATVRQPLGCVGLHCSKVAHGSAPIRRGALAAPCSRVVLVGFVTVDGLPRPPPDLPMDLGGDLAALRALAGAASSSLAAASPAAASPAAPPTAALKRAPQVSAEGV